MSCYSDPMSAPPYVFLAPLTGDKDQCRPCGLQVKTDYFVGRLQPVLLSVQYEYTKINSKKKGFFYFSHSFFIFSSKTCFFRFFLV